MRTPRNYGLPEEKRLKEKYNKIVSAYSLDTKKSFRKLSKELKYSRDVISWNVSRFNAISALKNLEDDTFLKIAETIPLYLYKGLTSLRNKKKVQIQTFFKVFGGNLLEFKASEYQLLKLLCSYYWSKQIKNYLDFLLIVSRIEKKAKKKGTTRMQWETSIMREIEELRKENSILKESLRRHGIPALEKESSSEQKKIDFEK